jgi:hypothetical protein
VEGKVLQVEFSGPVGAVPCVSRIFGGVLIGLAV